MYGFHPGTDLATYQIGNFFYGVLRFRASREQEQMHHRHHYKWRHIQVVLV